MDIKIKIGKTSEAYLKGILNAYIKNRKKMVQYGSQPAEFKEYLAWLEKKKNVFIFSIEPNNQNLKHLINLIRKKNPIVEHHYTTKGLRDIIFSTLRPIVLEKKTLLLEKSELSNVKKNLEKNLGRLNKVIYAFQVLHLKHSCEDVVFENAKIVNLNLNEIKPMVMRVIADAIPKFHPDYAFIQVEEFGNDSTVLYRKCYTQAQVILALLKSKFSHTPLMRLHDTYMVKTKENSWSVAFSSTEVTNWDSEIKSAKDIEFLKEQFSNILKPNLNNEYLEQIKISLIRYSRAQNFFIDSLKLAETIGSLETVLTTRKEGKNPKINICNLIYKRICSLLKIAENFPLKQVLESNYDTRSDYYHQSMEATLGKDISTIKWVFMEVICQIDKQLDLSLSKKQFLNKLDKSSISS